MWKQTALFIVCLIAFFSAGHSATTQEQPAKEEHPSVVARKRLADLRANLSPVKPPKDILRSLEIFEEITSEMRATQVQLVILITNGTPPVRRQAAMMLGEVSKDPIAVLYAVKSLTERLDTEKDANVIGGIYLGLARLAPYDKSTLPRFVQGLKHPDPVVRRAATSMFWHFKGCDDVLIPAAISALDDTDLGPDPKHPGVNCPSEFARRFIYEKRMAAKAAAPSLAKIATSHKGNDDYRFRAFYTLAAVAPDHPLALNTARAWLKKTNEVETLQRASGILCEMGIYAKDAVPDLIAVANMKPNQDPAAEQRLKISIVRCFECLGPVAKEALPTLEALASTSDLTLRPRVIEAIKAIQVQK